MLIKINAKESVEILEGVFVNVINDDGSKYYSWDELSDSQVKCFSGMACDFKEVFKKYKEGMTA